MTETEFQTLLHDLLNDYDELLPGNWPGQTAETFEEAGVLTYNKGLVVRFDDGSEYQVTLVRSR